VENTYRDVNVALANEISLICEKYGIDVEELIKVCNSHPRVHLLKPGPGVGGPCLPKDPYLLLSPQGIPQISSKLILESRKINDQMPSHVVNLIAESLAAQNKDPKNSSVLILGVAYKANVSDTRFSPAKQIVTELIDLGSKVHVYDPFTSETFGGEPVSDIWSIMPHVDVLSIVTDHDEFKKLDLMRIKKIMKQIPIVVDTRRIFTRKNAEEIGINYIAVGYNKKTQKKFKKIETGNT
ncbi:MAG: nucleotide sugar dehydrogenase, partial [Nitrosopumilaceae archaeon]